MTFFHFVNCAVLAFSPYFLIYKYSALSEYSTWFQCVHAGGVYFLTQFVKLLTYATFFPVPENYTVTGIEHFIFNIGDLFDILGIWLAINVISGKGEVRFMVAGFSWASAHSLATHLLPLIIGARKMAFKWNYIQRSVEANADLVFFIGLATLVWLSRRADTNGTHRWAQIFLAVGWARSVVFAILEQQFLASWSLLAAKIAYSVIYGALALVTYSNQGSVQRY